MANTINKIKVINADDKTTVIGTYDVGTPNVYVSPKGNLNIETSAEIGNTAKGKINIESMDDVQIKPGDDILLYSHHRPEDKQDELAIKVMNGSETNIAKKDYPVKLQVNCAGITLTTKDKKLDDLVDTSKKEEEEFNVNVNTGKTSGNTKGYLKVRARAIDLRCEEHGGVAIQPYGHDSDGNMNKVKFEHGGGDGLEFFTDNTEKFSAFNDEYRFNKYGTVKLATREKTVSDKYQAGKDETTHYKYVKQNDDFYDVIDEGDETATWNSIIKTSNAFNDGKNRHAKFTSGGNLEIETVKTYYWAPVVVEGGVADDVMDPQFPVKDPLIEFNEKDILDNGCSVPVVGNVYQNGANMYRFLETAAPNINLKSEGKINLESSKDITVTTGTGETDFVKISTPTLKFEYKLTKKGNIEGADPTLTYSEYNNFGAPINDMPWTGSHVKGTVDISCKLSDVIRLVNWMKDNNQGPWQL